MLEILGYIAFLFMGFVLGSIGAGGSIITLPILTYLFGMDFVEATTYSLILVGVTSLIGMFLNKRETPTKEIVIFAIPSIITIFLFRYYIIKMIPETIYGISASNILNNSLSILITYLGYKLLRNNIDIDTNTKKQISYFYIIFIAIITSSIMGLLGVGGGFIIVPCLMFFLKLDAKDAKYASLVIIASNTLIGFLADNIAREFHLDYMLLMICLIISSLGMAIGIFTNSFLSNKVIKKFFGLFMILLGPILILKSIF